jgi:UDP-N-acetylglucosamine transferase subunit ALG13
LPTPVKINNPDSRNPRVLVAPLDWGLGHATRCIPIIKELLNWKCEVIIASTGAQKALLQREFPSLTFVELAGYGISYDKNRALTILRLIATIPKILIRIKQEKAWLKQFSALSRPDLVIADNRYGLALPGVFCIFVTHQLRIRTSFGRIADTILQWMNYRFIEHFSRCWVPDVETGEGLAGALSHPTRLPDIPTKYIGWLSRFGKISQQDGDSAPDADDPELLMLLSGPEPQRSLFEASIITQAGRNPCRMILVRGLPAGGPMLSDIPSGLIVYDHLPAAELESLMKKARLVVARSGYSTVMDLARLGKRSLLIPTPGQPEQEYLGRFLAGKGWAVCVKQSDFSLQGSLSLARAEITGVALAEPGAAPKATGVLPAQPEGSLLEAEIGAVLAMLEMDAQV